MVIRIISGSERRIVVLSGSATLKKVDSGVVVAHGGGSSGGLVMCVGCGRHVDDGVMTFKCLLSVDAMLKINGGSGSV